MKRPLPPCSTCNDKYALDGQDPNSYANILWCFGLHDRPWAERPIFGMVRYMSRAACAAKPTWMPISGNIANAGGLRRRFLLPEASQQGSDRENNHVNITITGASGFIGRRLLKTLGAGRPLAACIKPPPGHQSTGGVRLSSWDPVKVTAPEDALRDADAVINLAGEPVAQRWSEEVKRRIRESRVSGTRNLVQGIARLAEKTTRQPAVLICASATGYYGTRGDEPLSETSPPALDSSPKPASSGSGKHWLPDLWACAWP